jgi:hypothetical protein
LINNQKQKDPIRKAHFVGTSVVLTLDPAHVKRLNIDDFTFFLERPVENGILLEKLHLNMGGEEEAKKL